MLKIIIMKLLIVSHSEQRIYEMGFKKTDLDHFLSTNCIEAIHYSRHPISRTEKLFMDIPETTGLITRKKEVRTDIIFINIIGDQQTFVE